MQQRINNNVVLASNDINRAILVGKGIGFKKKRGSAIEESEIRDKYFQSSNLHLEQIVTICDGVSEQQFDCLGKIVCRANQMFGGKINPNLLFFLLDHIIYAIKRQKEGAYIVLPIEWEINKYYPSEYQLAKESLAEINKCFAVNLLENEIVMIALHFINAQNDAQSNTKIVEIIELSTKIIKIVNYYFSIQFDEESIVFQRFVTHIKYYLMRQQRKEKLFGDSSLIEVVENKYPDEAKCVSKIADFMKSETDYQVSDVEKMYLILHVGNLLRSIQR